MSKKPTSSFGIVRELFKDKEAYISEVWHHSMNHNFEIDLYVKQEENKEPKFYKIFVESSHRQFKELCLKVIDLNTNELIVEKHF